MNAITPPAKRDIVTSVSFNDLRLPYYPAFADGFGIDNIRWKVLIDTVYPMAKSVDSIAMALSYCKQRNLDPFKRPVHIVPMWSSAKGEMVETVWPGISELRTTATRTGEYAGCDAAEFGPTIKRTFTGMTEVWENKKKIEREANVPVEFPEWCQVTIHRFIKGQRVAFVGPKAYWIEAYARGRKSEIPNEMWCKRPFGQIEKCAEAAALRRAFPEEIGNEYTAEEMEGQTIFAAHVSQVETQKPKLPPPPPAASAPAAKSGLPPPPPAPMPTKGATTFLKPAPAPPTANSAAFDFAGLRDALRAAPNEDAANAVFDDLVTQRSRSMTDEELSECDAVMRDACRAFVPDGE